MARAKRFEVRAAARRWRRLLPALVGLIAAAVLAAAAVRFSRSWRVPQVAVAGAPARTLVALKNSLFAAPGGEVPWGLLDASPQLTMAGELIATHPRPDGNLQYFQEVGFPWVPGLRQPCPTWGDDFASGASVFDCRFASPDSATALIAYYRRRLGEGGMTQDGPGSVTWVLPRATGNPGVDSRKALTIQPYDLARERSISSCLVAPSIAARAVVIISEMSRVRDWPRR